MVGTTCKPAIKAFPALMALARSFSHSDKKITDFARLLVSVNNRLSAVTLGKYVLCVPGETIDQQRQALSVLWL